jgi:hypothetical protein
VTAKAKKRYSKEEKLEWNRGFWQAQSDKKASGSIEDYTQVSEVWKAGYAMWSELFKGDGK